MGSSPRARQRPRIVGNCFSSRASPTGRRSSQRLSTPCSCMRRARARLTWSRGARSPPASWATGLAPCWSHSRAPSPRTASLIRKWGAPGSIRAVGWNCTNSRSRTAAPANQAMATPSPLAWAGLVVWANRWPPPPQASTTARARNQRRLRPSSTCRPTQLPPSTHSCRAGMPLRCTRPGRRSTSRSRASTRAPPVRSWAWSTRRWLWAASRVVLRSPASRSKAMPSSTSRATQVGASCTSRSTAAGSHRPAPARRVSAMWLWKLSSGRVTAAMPPWAQRLAEGGPSCLLSSSTRRPAGSSRQVINPAAPLPTTTTSHWAAVSGSITAPCCRRAYGTPWAGCQRGGQPTGIKKPPGLRRWRAWPGA